MHEVFENSERPSRRDAVVLGSGPAGLAIARELGRAGMQVACVAPDPSAKWSANYGAWLDDLGMLHEAACLHHVWREPFVRIDDTHRIALERAYGRFDNDTLQQHLAEEFVGHGGMLVSGRAERVEHHGAGSWVHLDDGSKIEATVVVDATGPTSAFVSRPRQRPAFQSAYGELLEVEAHDFAQGEMALMDFSGDGAEPTFLYAMPLSERLLFVEETSLVGRPPMSHQLLHRRLQMRMAGLDVRVERVVDREVCLIPMGHGVPNAAQRTIAYGSSAAFVHPATGYQIARALRLARPTAAAIAADLTSPQRAARAAYEVMWPASERRAWDLYTFGMEVLAGFDTDQMRSFMASFFELPTKSWSGFMSGTLSAGQVATAMARVFVNVGGDLRWSLIGASTRTTSKPLWRAMLAGGVS